MKNLRTIRGFTPIIGENVFIDCAAVVSGNVTLGHDSSVWPCVSIRGDLMPITIGARSNIQDGAVLHTTHQSEFNPDGFALTIGNEVTVGHHATLHGCTIYDASLIGMNAVVLDGAIVESHVVVGAGSLVAPGKRLTSGYLYLGNPARQARPLTEQEHQFFQYSADNYVKLKDEHLDR